LSGHAAGRAIDGNADRAGPSCAHTNKDSKPWWEVDLQKIYHVSDVRVFNRGDCCGSRLNNFYVSVGEASCGGPFQISSGG